jgi:hypothetical protein
MDGDGQRAVVDITPSIALRVVVLIKNGFFFNRVCVGMWWW